MLTIRSAQMQALSAAMPNQKLVQPCRQTATWIEIQLLDEDAAPVAGATYILKLPEGSIMEGTLDDEGLARFDEIVPGTCEINFPGIDGSEWKQV